MSKVLTGGGARKESSSAPLAPSRPYQDTAEEAAKDA
jgi:hypothetical protein